MGLSCGAGVGWVGEWMTSLLYTVFPLLGWIAFFSIIFIPVMCCKSTLNFKEEHFHDTFAWHKPMMRAAWGDSFSLILSFPPVSEQQSGAEGRNLWLSPSSVWLVFRNRLGHLPFSQKPSGALEKVTGWVWSPNPSCDLGLSYLDSCVKNSFCFPKIQCLFQKLRSSWRNKHFLIQFFNSWFLIFAYESPRTKYFTKKG